jgi:hypothetical protein
MAWQLNVRSALAYNKAAGALKSTKQRKRPGFANASALRPSLPPVGADCDGNLGLFRPPSRYCGRGATTLQNLNATET